MIRLRRRHHTIRYNQTQLPPRQRGPATALIVALPGGVLVVWLLFTTILRWYGYGTERSIRDSLISNYGAGPDNWMVDGYTAIAAARSPTGGAVISGTPSVKGFLR